MNLNNKLRDSPKVSQFSLNFSTDSLQMPQLPNESDHLTYLQAIDKYVTHQNAHWIDCPSVLHFPVNLFSFSARTLFSLLILYITHTCTHTHSLSLHSLLSPTNDLSAMIHPGRSLRCTPPSSLIKNDGSLTNIFINSSYIGAKPMSND